VNRTLQDRLVKELRLANISDIDAGNAFLPSFLLTHNERFAVSPVRSEDMHRPLSVSVDKLTDILCHREQRYVGSQLTLSYDRKGIILERNANSEDLGGKYVDVYDFPDAGWRYVPGVSYFPTASSARIRESATLRLSKTSVWATHWL
jgi:hypothetical protein